MNTEKNETTSPVETEEVEVFVCCDCGETHTDMNDMSEDNNSKLYCTDCYNERYFTCHHCDEESLCDESHETARGDYVCDYCYQEHYFTCDNCGDIRHNDAYADDGQCDNCYSSGDDVDSLLRKYSKDVYGSPDTTMSSRIFSCEIECYYPDISSLENIESKDMFKPIGITTDGSLDDNGIEFVTPMLQGNKGMELLNEFTKSLNDNNFTVNTSCGLHVHLDTKDYIEKWDRIKQLFIFCYIFEDVIMSFLPFSRRCNNFCKPLTNFYTLTEIQQCYNVEEFEKIWYREQSLEKISENKKEKYNQSRYAGVNFHSMLSNNHIEIRHHSGTTNFEKIEKWVKLWIAILDYFSQDNYVRDNAMRVQFDTNIKRKTKKFFEVLKLNDSDIEKYFINRQKLFTFNDDMDLPDNENQE